jgi:hypothetical protein
MPGAGSEFVHSKNEKRTQKGRDELKRKNAKLQKGKIKKWRDALTDKNY